MPRPQRYFRAGVGAVILDRAGRVLVLERSDRPGAWQFPQGGLIEEEEPEDGIWREVHEETGLTSRELELIARYPEPLVYELPERARRKKTGMGQVQYWFFFRMRGDRTDVPMPPDGEFRGWRWTSFDEAVEQATSFRRRVYERLREFANRADSLR
jgi:putative (di)nucleoside polyphosphate hydrolase